MAAWRLSVCCVVSIRVCASPPPKRARTDPAAFPSGLLLAPFHVSPAPRGIAARLVPNFPNIGVAPLGAALIHPLSAHRIICGLFSGPGETRRLAKHPSGRLRRCPSGSAYSKTERGSFPTKQACRKTVALGFPPTAGVSPLRGHCPAFAGRGGQSPRWWCRCQSAALCPLDCASHFSTPDCGRSSGFVSRSRNEAGFARVGGGRGAAMPRPLSDSVHGWTFACCLGLARPLRAGLSYGNKSQ